MVYFIAVTVTFWFSCKTKGGRLARKVWEPLCYDKSSHLPISIQFPASVQLQELVAASAPPRSHVCPSLPQALSPGASARLNSSNEHKRTRKYSYHSLQFLLPRLAKAVIRLSLSGYLSETVFCIRALSVLSVDYSCSRQSKLLGEGKYRNLHFSACVHLKNEPAASPPSTRTLNIAVFNSLNLSQKKAPLGNIDDTSYLHHSKTTEAERITLYRKNLWASHNSDSFLKLENKTLKAQILLRICHKCFFLNVFGNQTSGTICSWSLNSPAVALAMTEACLCGWQC